MPVPDVDRVLQYSGWVDFVKILICGLLILVVLGISIFNPYFGLVALALLLGAMILGLNLQWGVLVLICLLPFDPQLELKPDFFVYFDLLFILPVLVYAWKVAFGDVKVNWFSLALMPYVLFAIASGFWRAENFFWFSAYSARLIIAVLFMGVIACIGRAETITAVLGAALVPQVCYGLYQLLASDIGPLYLLVYPHYQRQPWTDRAYGFFFQPNNFGGYCATVSVMLLALGLRTKAPGLRIVYFILALFGFVGLASSGSRGAWIAAGVGLILLFMYSRARLGAKLGLVAVVILALAASQWFATAQVARAESLDTFTIESRTTMYLAAGLLFLQHPLIGVGLTNYQELMSSVVEWTFDAGNAAHNLYLQVLSENGSIGFLCFFLPLFYFLYRNLKHAQRSTTAMVSSVGLAVVLVHGLFDFQFATSPQYLLLFSVVFGLASQCLLAPGKLRSG